MSPSGFSPLLLTAIAEELASAGYVVVGVNHTYEAAVTVLPDGRVVDARQRRWPGCSGRRPARTTTRSAGVPRCVNTRPRTCARSPTHLNRLGPNGAGLSRDCLDLDRLGAFGHSFGGNAALEWCAADPRCLAAANLDGAIWTKVGTVGLSRPALQVLADHPEFDLPSDVAVAAGISPTAAWYDAERTIVHAGWRRVRERAEPGVTATIAGASHMGFMDIPFLPLRPESTVAGAVAATSIEPELMWRITCDLLLAFFGHYVAGAGGPDLNTASSRHPEVTIVTGGGVMSTTMAAHVSSHVSGDVSGASAVVGMIEP